MQLRDTTVTGLGGRARVCGPNSLFDPKRDGYPRIAIEPFERELDGRIIFVRNLSGVESLLLLEDKHLMMARINGKLEVVSHTHWLSLEIRDVGSIFLSAELAKKQFHQDRLVAFVVALDVPVVIIREFQRNLDSIEYFDGWSIVRMDDDAVAAYISAAKACPTGGPTRFEVFEAGPPCNLLRREIMAWRGENACYTDPPFTGVQRNQVLRIDLR